MRFVRPACLLALPLSRGGLKVGALFHGSRQLPTGMQIEPLPRYSSSIRCCSITIATWLWNRTKQSACVLALCTNPAEVKVLVAGFEPVPDSSRLAMTPVRLPFDFQSTPKAAATAKLLTNNSGGWTRTSKMPAVFALPASGFWRPVSHRSGRIAACVYHFRHA